MTFIGIDPGKAGGIAAVDPEGRILRVSKMPETDRDIYNEVHYMAHIDGATANAMLEFVRSSPQMGPVSAFTFGRGYGGLRMALVAASVPFDEVVPRKWQGAMSCLSGGDKNVTKARAQELFPVQHIRITHAVADALLLAEYCRRVHAGMLPAPRKSSRPVKTKEF